MSKLIAVVLSASLVTLSACASAPEDIQPQFTPTTAYQGLTCEQLRAQMTTVGAEVDKVTGQQTAKRRSDQTAVGVGLILFAPAALFLLTKDHKAELARLKGQFEAIQRQAEIEHCNI